jgi:hypothetical protein
MSTVTRAPAGERNRWLTMSAWRALFRDRPIIPLLALMVLLVILYELVRPGVVGRPASCERQFRWPSWPAARR